MYNVVKSYIEQDSLTENHQLLARRYLMCTLLYKTLKDRGQFASRLFFICVVVLKFLGNKQLYNVVKSYIEQEFKVAGAKDGNSAPDNCRRYVRVPCV